MTQDKLIEVVTFYREYLEQLPYKSDELWHLHSMTGAILRNFIPSGRIEKSMRWLGYLQGQLVARNHFTLEEVKTHSRSKEKEFRIDLEKLTLEECEEIDRQISGEDESET